MKKNFKLLTTTPIVFILAIFILNHLHYNNALTLSAIAILFIAVPWIWVYTKSLDKCMTKRYPHTKLTEGDWLDKDVMYKGKLLVKKTVHGLSLKDIKLIQKHKLKVQIKEGIPFTPAFLIALIIVTLFSQTLSTYLQSFLYFLI